MTPNYMTSTPTPEPSMLMTLATTADILADGGETEAAATPSFVSFADRLRISGQIAAAHDVYDLPSLPIDKAVEISGEKGRVLEVRMDNFGDLSVLDNDCLD